MGIMLFSMIVDAEVLELHPDAIVQGKIIKRTEDVHSSFKDTDEVHEIVHSLFNQNDFQKLDAIIDAAIKGRIQLKSGEWLLWEIYRSIDAMYNDLSPQEMRGFLLKIDMWRDQVPNSMNHITARANFYVTLAWAYRGSGYSKDIKEENQTGFRDNLEKAIQLFNSTEVLNTKNPEHYTQWIFAANANGGDVDAVFKKAVSVDPFYLPIYLKRAVTLLPRWGGYPGEVEKFASFVADQTKSLNGDEFYWEIANSVLEYVGMADFSKFQFDYTHIKSGLEQMIKRYPTDLKYQHYLGLYACLYKNREDAKKYFTQIKFDWGKSAWRVWKSDSLWSNLKIWAMEGGKYPEFVRNGMYKYYYDNGQVLQESNYHDGVYDGLTNTYFKSGAIKKHGFMIWGNMCGLNIIMRMGS